MIPDDLFDKEDENRELAAKICKVAEKETRDQTVLVASLAAALSLKCIALAIPIEQAIVRFCDTYQILKKESQRD